jgi:PmbA protein
VDKILSIARRSADSAEVFRVNSSRTPVHFEGNRLKQIQTKESTATALRLVKDGRVGFAQVSGPIDAAELVKMAVETSQFGYEVNFKFPASPSYSHVDIYDADVEQTSIDDMIRLGEEVIGSVRDNTPDIICEGSVSWGTATFSIANSAGLSASYKRTNSSISVDGMLVRKGDILYVGDVRSSCHPIEEARPVAFEIIRQLDLARNYATMKSGIYPVIFTPYGVAGALIAPLISALNGKTVFDGASPLKDKIGQAVLDKKFSITDDPLLPFQPGSTPFDDEGTPARRNVLVDAGTVKQFYYDLRTAALAGTASTGNGNRSGGMPAPSPHALVLSGGDISLENMVKDIKEGIIIEQLMGAEQGNILNGDFSGNILLGYKIESGSVVGRVKDTMAYGNVYQLLREIRGLGSDSRWIAGYINTPSIYCPSISVSSK